MSDDNTLRINKDKETTLDFQVQIDGADDILSKTIVKIVIDIDSKFALSFLADHTESDNWRVTIPVIPKDVLGDGSYDMRVEVIIDNYYFVPAKGKVTSLSEPTVTFGEAPKKAKEKIEERVSTGAGSADDMSAPTNALLKPEIKPKENATKLSAKTQKSPEDEHTNLSKIASEVVPGEGEPYAPDFNPQDVAEKIVLDALGIKPGERAKLVKQAGKGFLFKKDANGKPVVEGLDNPDFKKKLAALSNTQKEAKVKALLRELAD